MKVTPLHIMGLYLGFILGAIGHNFMTWQFWVVLAPCCVLCAMQGERR